MESLTTTSVAPVERPRASAWIGALAPSLTDFFFAALLAWLFLGMGPKALLSDGDTGWHIRTGDYILANRAVPHTDLFTFTKPDAPWFAWEWLTDVVFSYFHALWGVKAIALLGGLALCATAALVFCRMLWSGANLFIALTAALLTNGAMLVHFLARPHVFTFLFLAVSLWILARDRREPGRAIWLLAPITAVWVNMHGGFLALLVCLGLTAAGYGIQWLCGDRERSLFFLKRYTLVGAACALATLANPYGYKLHMHIAGFLQSDFVLDTVEEFQSPQFRGENMLQFEILLLGGLALVGLLLAKKKFAEALLVVFWAQASLTSVRHSPIFAIVAAPILAEELTALWNRWTEGKAKGSLAAILRDLGSEFSGSTLRVTIWIPMMILGLAMSMSAGDPEFWPQTFPKERFPIELVEEHAGMLAPVTQPMPRIFTSDQWADYLSYRFYPRIRIFVDGRSDFFGAALGKEYVALAGAGHSWETILDKYLIDIAILPSEWPLAELLKRHPGWRLVRDSKKALLFERRTPVLMKNRVSAESSSSTIGGAAR
jgi:hypothetical protein